jgi:uncharacterized protein YhaN
VKLNRLNLIRFGPYTDFNLDLESGNKQFHMIYGPNEAGKSTALRAISGLLYGIEETTTDDHLHGKADLRIGAVITEGREAMAIIRRKGRKNTLLDRDEQPVDESLLTSRYLHGVSKELFLSMFGLGHDELVHGGRKLLAGEGEVGESLFGATAGIRNIHALRQALRNEADSLFTAQARNKPLNLAMRKFREAEKKAAQLSLRPKVFLDLQEQFAEARDREAELGKRIKALAVELEKKERLQRTLPLIARRTTLLEKKSALAGLKPVPESCTTERITAQGALERAEERIRQLLREIRDLCTELDVLYIPVGLLARQSEVQDLQSRVAVTRKALGDISGLEREIRVNLHEAAQILRSLGRPEATDDIEDLRIDLATQEAINALSREFVRHETNLQTAEKNFTEARLALEELQKSVESLSSAPAPDELENVLARIRRKGDLDGDLGKLRAEIDALKQEAEQQCRSLWTGVDDYEAITRLPVPLKETVEEYEGLFQNLGRKRDNLENQAVEVQKRMDRLRINLAELEQKEAVLAESVLLEVRARRDELWQEVKRVWEAGRDPAGERPRTIVTAYEQSVAEADETSDALRKNADLVARYTTLSFDRERTEEELARVLEQLQTVKGEEEQLSSRWRALIEPLRIKEYSPREFSGWLRLFEKFSETFSALRKKEREVSSLHNLIAKYAAQVHGQLLALSEEGARAEESFPDLLERAERVVARLREKRLQREQNTREILKAEKSLESRKAELDRQAKKLDDWRKKWAAAIRQLGYDANTDVEVVSRTMEVITRLFSKTDDAARLRMRVSQIQEDAGQLEEDVRGFASTYSPESLGADFSETVRDLVSRVTAGNEAVNRRKKINSDLKKKQDELKNLEGRKNDASEVISRLLQSGGCRTTEELENIEEKSKELREILMKLEDVDEQLLREGVSIGEMIEQAADIDRDALPAEIQELREKLEELNTSRSSILTDIGSLKTELAKLDGARDAADAAADAEEEMAAITQHVETYTRLKLSAAILEREIENYRKKNQAPIMQRTAEIFRRITLGSFRDLTTGFDEKDRLVFLCVRNDGRQLTVDGLSEGTRDQLYLALRIAGIEHHMEHNAPLPVIVDDLLIKADDFRSRAILEILGELSRKTQIIFFTHHSRLVELARETIPEDLLKEHELPGHA